MGKKHLGDRNVRSVNEPVFQWYVVRTHYNGEERAAENIRNRFVTMGAQDHLDEILVPVVNVRERDKRGTWRNKRVRVVEGGYLFIRMIMTNLTWNIVRQAPLVSGWLSSGGKPVPLSEGDVMRIKHRMYELALRDGKVDGDPMGDFKGRVGDAVRITVMNGIEGRIVGITPEKGTIRVVTANGFKFDLKPYQVEVVGEV